MLDLKDEELQEVKQILGKHLAKEVEVFAYGSRVKNKARKFSDLDLVLKTAEPVSRITMITLQEGFTASNLPFITELIDWHAVSPDFQEHITKDLIRLSF